LVLVQVSRWNNPEILKGLAAVGVIGGTAYALGADPEEIALAAGIHRPVLRSHRQVHVSGIRRAGGIEPVFRVQCSIVVIDTTTTKKSRIKKMTRKMMYQDQ
jgi:hypothetical protein